MISVQEALRLVVEDLEPLGSERVMLRSARGRVLAEPVVALRDVPPFRNSAMDGYAVRAADVESAATAPVGLRILETVGAGSAPTRSVEPGSATKIMTGSPMPSGADAVVKVEDTTEADGRVLVRAAVEPGANVREPGEDMRSGEAVLDAGRCLRPADIGLLASLGIAGLLVHRRPRVAILSTGDELVDVGEPLGPGQIVNSNAYTLAAAVEEAGAEAVVLGIARDQPETLRAALASALTADVVLSTGGVSVGSFDYVRRVQAELGVCEKFWRVSQKPGKPLSYGLHGSTPVFGLPGNPVSTLVCYYIYVLPALRRRMGDERPYLPAVSAEVSDDMRKVAGLTEFIRCGVSWSADGGYRVRSTGSQSSGVLRSMSAGEALVVGPPELSVLPRGSTARAILLAPGGAAAVPPF